MFIMTTDVMCVALLVMMFALVYCVVKLCLSLLNACKRIFQITEMGAGEQMLVKELQTPREAYKETALKYLPSTFLRMRMHTPREG